MGNAAPGAITSGRRVGKHARGILQRGAGDMPALRAVAYYRKSNDDDGSSIDQQREWAHTACQKEGIELVREFADQAKKGHETATRTAFHEMLAFCQQEARRKSTVRAIVTWHTNRFSRSDSQ